VQDWWLRGLDLQAYDVDSTGKEFRFQRQNFQSISASDPLDSLSSGESRMTRKQFIATSIFLGFIPAAGLLAVLALGVIGSANDLTPAKWILYGTTFIGAIFTLASPVAIVLLIPKDAAEATQPPGPATDSIDGEEELIGSSDADDDFDEYEEEFDDYDTDAPEVASLDDDGFEDEFDDFDDDDDFA